MANLTQPDFRPKPSTSTKIPAKRKQSVYDHETSPPLHSASRRWTKLQGPVARKPANSSSRPTTQNSQKERAHKQARPAVVTSVSTDEEESTIEVAQSGHTTASQPPAQQAESVDTEPEEVSSTHPLADPDEDPKAFNLSVDLGGSSYKACFYNDETSEVEFISRYPGSSDVDDRTRESPPSWIGINKDGDLVAGFLVNSTGRATVRDGKVTLMADRNTTIDRDALARMADALSTDPSEVEVDDWVGPIFESIIHGLQEHRHLSHQKRIMCGVSVLNATPITSRVLIQEAVEESFRKSGFSNVKIITVAESQCMMKAPSFNQQYLADLQDKMVVIIDFGGTSVDFVAGTYDAKKKMLHCKYNPTSLLRGGTNFEEDFLNAISSSLKKAVSETTRAVLPGLTADIASVFTTDDLSSNSTPLGRIKAQLEKDGLPADGLDQHLTDCVITAYAKDAHAIGPYLERKVTKALQIISPDDREAGTAILWSGGGSHKYRLKLLEPKITSVLKDSEVSYREPDGKRLDVARGLLKILRELESGSIRTYTFSYGFIGFTDDGERELITLLEEGSPVFYQELNIWLMTEQSDHQGQSPKLPKRITIIRWSQKDQAASARLSPSFGEKVGILELDPGMIEKDMFVEDPLLQPATRQAAASKKKLPKDRLEWQLCFRVAPPDRLICFARTAKKEEGMQGKRSVYLGNATFTLKGDKGF